jgi:hypothetical protein
MYRHLRMRGATRSADHALQSGVRLKPWVNHVHHQHNVIIVQQSYWYIPTVRSWVSTYCSSDSLQYTCSQPFAFQAPGRGKNLDQNPQLLVRVRLHVDCHISPQLPQSFCAVCLSVCLSLSLSLALSLSLSSPLSSPPLRLIRNTAVKCLHCLF